MSEHWMLAQVLDGISARGFGRMVCGWIWSCWFATVRYVGILSYLCAKFFVVQYGGIQEGEVKRN